jgi:hypothetical protein
MSPEKLAQREAARAIESLARALAVAGDWRDKVPEARELLIDMFGLMWMDSDR